MSAGLHQGGANPQRQIDVSTYIWRAEIEKFHLARRFFRPVVQVLGYQGNILVIFRR
jgi:hypothetical protein